MNKTPDFDLFKLAVIASMKQFPDTPVTLWWSAEDEEFTVGKAEQEPPQANLKYYGTFLNGKPQE